MSNNIQGVKGVKSTAYENLSAYDALPMSLRKAMRDAPINFDCTRTLAKFKKLRENSEKQEFVKKIKAMISVCLQQDPRAGTLAVYGPTHPQAAPQHTGG